MVYDNHLVLDCLGDREGIVMGLFSLKIVPDAKPNADGKWIVCEVPIGMSPWGFIPREGYHVVSWAAFHPYPTGQEPQL